MVECGVNLALVAVTWLAIYLWTRRREWLGGLCLGLVISLKCTPLAFLGYFLWKRQWKMAIATVAATVLFSLLPALWMGATPYADAMRLWASYARRGLTEQDPNSGVLGDEKVQNLSLRPALAALVSARAGETSAADFAQHWALPPATAGIVIKTALAALALAVAWQFRRKITDRRDPVVLWECAIVSIAVLLYSPITWTQHCVGILPAMYLLALSAQLPGRVPRWAWLVLAGYALAILVLNRAVLGRELSLALMSYHVHAWSLVGLFFVALACHRRATAGGREATLANSQQPCNLPPRHAGPRPAQPLLAAQPHHP
jgi:alpha-1,2-mannosyltransferase